LRNQSFWLNYEYKLKHYRSTLQISDVHNRVNNHSKNPFKNPYSWIKAKRFNKYQQEYNQFCLKAKKFV
jgi:hypothetical protein